MLADTLDTFGGGYYKLNVSTSENPLSHGGRWLTGGRHAFDWQDPKIVAGWVQGSGTVSPGPPYTDPIACLRGSNWLPAQTIIGVVRNTNPQSFSSVNEELELSLHWSIGWHKARGYEVNWSMSTDNHYHTIVRWNSGTYTQLKQSFGNAIVTNDILKATITSGNFPVITTYVNNVQMMQYDTATGNDGGTPGTPDSLIFTDGSPGMGFYLSGAGASESHYDDFGFLSYEATATA